jgi:hypothetical protein
MTYGTLAFFASGRGLRNHCPSRPTFFGSGARSQSFPSSGMTELDAVSACNDLAVVIRIVKAPAARQSEAEADRQCRAKNMVGSNFRVTGFPTIVAATGPQSHGLTRVNSVARRVHVNRPQEFARIPALGRHPVDLVRRDWDEPDALQEVEITDTPMVVMEHQGLAYWCPRCRKVHHPPMPEAVVIATCAQQWRAVFQFLLESVQSHLRSTSAPSLFESREGRYRGYLVFHVTLASRRTFSPNSTRFARRVPGDGFLGFSRVHRKTCAGLLRSGWLRPRPARLPDRKSRSGRTRRRSVPRRVVFRDFEETVVETVHRWTLTIQTKTTAAGELLCGNIRRKGLVLHFLRKRLTLWG